MRQLFRGTRVSGIATLAVGAVLFAIVRLMPDDLGRGVLLTFIGTPVLVVLSLWGGWAAAVRNRRVIGVLGAVAVAIAALLLSWVVMGPVRGIGAGAAFLFIAGMVAISTAAGYLICVATLPERSAS